LLTVDNAKDNIHLFFPRGERLLVSRQLTGQFSNYEAMANQMKILDRVPKNGNSAEASESSCPFAKRAKLNIAFVVAWVSYPAG
jgi:hypothetical protein